MSPPKHSPNLQASPELRQHIMRTYINLRIGLMWLAIALPLMLWISGFFEGRLEPYGSMSAYYFTPMRNLFVGVLFSIGSFLFLYKGFSNWENHALNLAGLFAIGIALLPTMPPPGLEKPDEFISPRMHGICAVLFFFTIAYVCVFRSKDTLHLMSDEKLVTRYRRIYKTLGTLMVLLPLLAAGLVFGLQMNLDPEQKYIVFIVELVAVWVFGTYWLTKSFELKGQSQSLECQLVAHTEDT